MTETEKIVGRDTTGKTAVSATSEDHHGYTKEITPRDILISAAIVLTQLVQVRMLSNSATSKIDDRSLANIRVDDTIRIGDQRWSGDWQKTWCYTSRVNLDCGIIPVCTY
jgi:hypothetical protein